MKKAKKKVRRKEAPVIAEEDIRTIPVPRGVGTTFELFTVLISGLSEYRCLVKALISPNPHVMGHVLGEVVRMHAAIYEKTFGVDRDVASAMILEGIIHELEESVFNGQGSDPRPVIAEEYEAQEAIKRKKGLH